MSLSKVNRTSVSEPGSPVTIIAMGSIRCTDYILKLKKQVD